MPRPRLQPRAVPPALVATLCLACGSGVGAPPVPLPEGLAALDAEVVARIETARDGVLATPGDAEAWMALGMTYEAHDLFRLAVECYVRALDLGPEAKAWYRRALAHSKLGQGAEAIAALEAALALVPDDPALLARLGTFQFDEGLLDEAEASFRRAVDLDPDRLRAWMGLARVHLLRDRPQEAVALLEAQRSRRPGHGYIQKLLRTAYLGAGRGEEARRLPAVTPTWQPLGASPWQREFRQYLRRPLLERAGALVWGDAPDKGVVLLEEFLREGSEDVNALCYLAVGYLKTGRVEDAQRTLADAEEREPGSVIVLRSRAFLERTLGSPDDVVATYERILELDPTHLETWKDLGALHAGRGRHAEAAAAYAGHVALDQSDPEVWAGLGLALAADGRPGEAREPLERALASAPTDRLRLALVEVLLDLGLPAEARASLGRVQRESARRRELEERLRAAEAGR